MENGEQIQLKKHKKYVELVKKVRTIIIIIIKLIRSAKNDKKRMNEAKLYWDAMCDGFRGNLGKNDNYLPGGKN